MRGGGRWNMTDWGSWRWAVNFGRGGAGNGGAMVCPALWLAGPCNEAFQFAFLVDGEFWNMSQAV